VRAFDTNLLVRILTRDDVRQVALIDLLLADAEESGEVFFVPVTVLLELEWVLRSAYARGKTDWVGALNSLLRSAALEIEHHAEVVLALDAIAEHGRADFADALHVAITSNAGHGPLLTFDTGCARLLGAELLR
jgi:predicted nucleic-acid-binding protein